MTTPFFIAAGLAAFFALAAGLLFRDNWKLGLSLKRTANTARVAMERMRLAEQDRDSVLEQLSPVAEQLDTTVSVSPGPVEGRDRTVWVTLRLRRVQSRVKLPAAIVGVAEPLKIVQPMVKAFLADAGPKIEAAMIRAFKTAGPEETEDGS